jgi:hypothetical protein
MACDLGGIVAIPTRSAGARMIAGASAMRRCTATTTSGSSVSGFGRRLLGGGMTKTHVRRDRTTFHQHGLATCGAAGEIDAAATLVS